MDAGRTAADRFSAPLFQEALTDFITSGEFERYLRRAGARNAARRRALIGALRQHFGERVEIAGENTGVHLVVWLNDVRPRDLDAIIGRAPVIRDTPVDVIADVHARRYVPGSVGIAAAGSVDPHVVVIEARRAAQADTVAAVIPIGTHTGFDRPKPALDRYDQLLENTP